MVSFGSDDPGVMEPKKSLPCADVLDLIGIECLDEGGSVVFDL